jgi:hypothetical protein
VVKDLHCQRQVSFQASTASTARLCDCMGTAVRVCKVVVDGLCAMVEATSLLGWDRKGRRCSGWRTARDGRFLIGGSVDLHNYGSFVPSSCTLYAWHPDFTLFRCKFKDMVMPH